jgi:hypothetical protein
MANRPLSVSVSLIFILLNALFWLAFGAIIAADVHPALPTQPLPKGVMAFLSFSIAGILVGVFIFFGKHNRIAYFITLGLFIATSLLTIFDQLGLSDLLIPVINMVPIVLLIKDRAWYLEVKPRAMGIDCTA